VKTNFVVFQSELTKESIQGLSIARRKL